MVGKIEFSTIIARVYDETSVYLLKTINYKLRKFLYELESRFRRKQYCAEQHNEQFVLLYLEIGLYKQFNT